MMNANVKCPSGTRTPRSKEDLTGKVGVRLTPQHMSASSPWGGVMRLHRLG